METSVTGIYVAGDVAGIEEASTAMEEGRLAGLAVAQSLGYIPQNTFNQKAQEIRQRLSSLRIGPFGEMRRQAKRKLISNANKGG
jgi:pyruvate/2-oxoglutarate dehydrogenase complex dihydrolipoamide dehydrogenase (E3) component